VYLGHRTDKADSDWLSPCLILKERDRYKQMAGNLDLRNKRILIVEENSMLSLSMKNMLKKMGGAEDKVHKAQNIVTYRQLINQYSFDVIICSYMSQKRVVGAKYFFLYQQSRSFSRNCSFVMIANSSDEAQLKEVQELEPDNILGHPFNYIQLKQTVSVSLLKRDILIAVHKHLVLGYFESVMNICDAQLKRKGEKWFGCHKVVVDYYAERDNYGAAFEVLERLHQQVKHPWPLIKQITLHLQIGNDDQALVLAHEYELLGYPEDPIVSQITAYQSLLDSNVERAVAVMSNLCQRFPHRVELTINCSMLHVGVGEYHKALCCLAKADDDAIVSDAQRIEIEELRLFLDLIIAFQIKGKLNPASLKATLNQVLVLAQPSVIDSRKVTKGLYQLLLQMNSCNPVCSPKRLDVLYAQTHWQHRKLILIAVALHIGCLGLVQQWMPGLQQQNISKKNLAAAVNGLILKRVDMRLASKLNAIKIARAKESSGSMVDSLAIKAKEAPYYINHHSHFINAMLKYNVASHPDRQSLEQQFTTSIDIVIANLMKQDPMHPKVNKILQAKQIVEQRLASFA
jgi:CheY-like chemotaxis protein